MLQVGPWVFAAGQVASDYKTGVAPEARRNLEAVKLQSLDLFGAQRDGSRNPRRNRSRLACPALHEGERFPEIAKSKRALDAAGIIAQFPLRRLALETQGFSTRKRRDAAATRRAGFLREGLGHVAVSNVTNKCNGGRSAI